MASWIVVLQKVILPENVQIVWAEKGGSMIDVIMSLKNSLNCLFFLPSLSEAYEK